MKQEDPIVRSESPAFRRGEDVNDHETALRAAQAAVDADRARLDGSLGERRRAVLHARADKMSIYRIAQILGLAENAVRQDLGRGVSRGIVLLDPTDKETDK